MKSLLFKIFFISALTIVFLGVPIKETKAQCAMCSLTAESSVKNGNTQGKTLNKGILFLLGCPFLAVGIVGLVWFKKYRDPEEPDDHGPEL
ncbi:hypothetical protein [Albibacterium sp.]|uniref:hypothetical protein n=1 Tax=Albibacterium sp. TaxID=2952885 RepID=UPI002C0A7A16|nr:hypothetical protein [Albibacterium sp.]HUH19777.1 hypothetical protein [Albibacterium sp.]